MKQNKEKTTITGWISLILISLLLQSCNTHFYNTQTLKTLVVKDNRDSVVLQTPVQGRFVINTKYLSSGYTVLLLTDNNDVTILKPAPGKGK